jgi:hypothetical protein
MRFRDLLTDADRAGLAGWLGESPTGDLFVNLERPHGGPKHCYLIRSIADLDAILVSAADWQELVLEVLRRPQLQLRGLADAGLAERALAELPDGDWYAAVSLPPERSPTEDLQLVSATNDKAELERDLLTAAGTPVAVGLDPLEGDRASRANAEQLFYLGVHRNRNQWPPYR